jgi:hypothetical protein
MNALVNIDWYLIGEIAFYTFCALVLASFVVLLVRNRRR